MNFALLPPPPPHPDLSHTILSSSLLAWVLPLSFSLHFFFLVLFSKVILIFWGQRDAASMLPNTNDLHPAFFPSFPLSSLLSPWDGARGSKADERECHLHGKAHKRNLRGKSLFPRQQGNNYCVGLSQGPLFCWNHWLPFKVRAASCGLGGQGPPVPNRGPVLTGSKPAAP